MLDNREDTDKMLDTTETRGVVGFIPGSLSKPGTDNALKDMKMITMETSTMTRTLLLPASSPNKGMTARENVEVTIQRRTLRPLATSL